MFGLQLNKYEKFPLTWIKENRIRFYFPMSEKLNELIQRLRV